MSSPTLRQNVIDQLAELSGTSDLFTTGNDFFGKALGYDTSLRSRLSDNSYSGFDEVYVQGDEAFDPEKALVNEWDTVEVLFQLTEEQMVKTIGLFATDQIDDTLMESYIFVAIDLKKENYSRTNLAQVARQINSLFRQPVLLLFRYGSPSEKLLTLAVIDRRINKKDKEKDVLKKVTFIKDIVPANPNRAHVDILSDLHQHELLYREPKGKRRKPRNFVELHRAWRQVLSVSELNKRFYQELSDWFFWATGKDVSGNTGVDFQFSLLAEKERDAARARAVIRLITRIIFVWFLKEKGLVPGKLFDRKDLAREGIDFDKDDSAYYKAVLQNLFFATLNTKIKNRGTKSTANYQGKTKEYGNPSLLRHTTLCTKGEDHLKSLFDTVPFLNGGLFECLDKRKEGVWIDCFTEGKKQPIVPNELFFAEEAIDVDLNKVYGTKGRKSQVRGLFPILNSYKFTIDENTPVEEEVALDPELLGKVFENLLAAYNEETKDTARRQTGSFYTPREIVNYMVEEGLIAYLEDYVLQRVKPKPTGPKFKPLQLGLFGMSQAVQTEFNFENAETAGEFRKKLKGQLRDLVSINQDGNPFDNPEEVHFIVEAIDAIRILDPAVGSGAYPMGVLQLLVHVLAKIDHGNVYWRKVQEANAIHNKAEGEDVGATFEKHAEDNYFRKLYLIQNCIFGVDIQPIAIQICKLRFFVSLAIDEKKNDNKEDNYGVKPLPNLETKFVAANSLVKLETQAGTFEPVGVDELKKELRDLRRKSFSLKSQRAKVKNRNRDAEIRTEIGDSLKGAGFPVTSADRVADWNPYDQSKSANWFDAEWMLGQGSFDLVIGNPPYRQLQRYNATIKKSLKSQGYETHENTGDIYSLFYERGVELLKQRGILSYITSNNWMRAKYGESTRKYFAKFNPLILVDFGMAQIFESATTYTNILILQKARNENKTQMVRVQDDFDPDKSDLTPYINENSSIQSSLNENSWVAYTQVEYDLKSRVEAQGVRLDNKDKKGLPLINKVWNIKINRGILTGYNEAFIIDQAKRDELIAADPKSEELIRPILRGRDIRAWVPAWSSLYLINSHNGIKANNIPPINVERDYPAIYDWFLTHEEKMVKRYDQGDHWTNLRNLAYLEEFDEPKIIFPNMTSSLPFVLDNGSGFLTNQKCYIITGKSISFLAGIFNSPLYRFCFKNVYPELLGNTFELSKTFFEKVSIKVSAPEQEWLFERLANYIIFAKKEEGMGAVALFFQQLVNGLVYELYFEKELSVEGISFMSLLTKDVIQELSDGKEADLLKSVYATLHNPTHPIRIGLFKLDTVKEVRIIEGKDN